MAWRLVHFRVDTFLLHFHQATYKTNCFSSAALRWFSLLRSLLITRIQLLEAKKTKRLDGNSAFVSKEYCQQLKIHENGNKRGSFGVGFPSADANQ